MPNVTVMSRDKAVRECYKQHERPTVMISISTPGYNYIKVPFQSNRNNIRTILRLYFEDIENGNGRMTYNDAVLIRKLLQSIDTETTDIIVHCDAGISRSAGVAAAILKHLTGSDMQIFGKCVYRPNMHCYRTVLNELYENYRKEEDQ